MRALRIATLLLATISLTGGATFARTTDIVGSIGPVAGTLAVHQLPGGTFEVEDHVFQYRDFLVAGSTHRVSDPRLSGDLVSAWNWDVQSSGDRPVPAWGTITIDGAEGSWSGDFSGIRQTDYAPIDMRAVLFGDGEFEGLCATLDITALEMALGDTWVLEGVVHPVDMT